MTMELHEQYETLIRRGMPEHLMLRKNSGKHQPFLLAEDEDLNGFRYVHPTVARDLITMHALSWLTRLGIKPYIELGWYEQDDLVSLKVTNAHHDVLMDVVDVPGNILWAIVCATAHLEPTNPEPTV